MGDLGMTQAAIITMQQLGFRYRRQTTPALANITIDIQPGSIVAIVGSAGAGKSTLCALMAGFMPQFFRGEVTGTIHVDGVSPIDQSILEMLQHTTIVTSQASTQISGVCDTVAEEVGFGLQNLGMAATDIRQRVQDALTMMGITHLSERSPFALSGGQQQRVVIAAALALRPPVLILDEPSAQLDPPAVQQLGETLQSLAAHGQTIVIAEHNLDWVAEFAHRILVLDAGRIVADGTPSVVFSQHSAVAGRPYATRLAQALGQQQLWNRALPLATTKTQLIHGLDLPMQPSINTRPLPTSAPSPTQPIMSIEDVAFHYSADTPVLHRINLHVDRGERIALLGKNGAGKSTLLRHFNGLLRPHHGRVVLDGHDIVKWAPGRASRIASIVFQDVRNQLFAASIQAEVAYGPQLLKLPASEITARVQQAMQLCGLADLGDVHPYDIPPARRRLVATAAVIAVGSDIIALDEPTAGMDEAGIAQLSHALGHLHAHQRSCIIVSHDLNFCVTHTDRVVLLKDGQIVLDAKWQHLTLADLALLDAEVGLPIGHACCLHHHIEPTSTIGQHLVDPAALR